MRSGQERTMLLDELGLAVPLQPCRDGARDVVVQADTAQAYLCQILCPRTELQGLARFAGNFRLGRIGFLVK